MNTLQKRTNSNGQATVESVLLIALSVLIILGLMSQFYKPLDRYLNAYMGPYLTCLLDVGELPALGGGEVSGECVVDPFKLGDASDSSRGPGFANINGRGGPKDEDSANNRKPRENAQPTDNVGGKSGPEGGVRNLGSSGRGAENRATRGGDRSQNEGKIVQELPEELAKSRYYSSSGSASNLISNNRRVIPYNGVGGMIGQEIERLERRQSRIRSVASFESSMSKSKKMIIKPPERKVAEASVDEPWSLGRLFRIALIVIMIIAIVLFVGGQALQISKGMEK